MPLHKEPLSAVKARQTGVLQCPQRGTSVTGANLDGGDIGQSHGDMAKAEKRKEKSIRGRGLSSHWKVPV